MVNEFPDAMIPKSGWVKTVLCGLMHMRFKGRQFPVMLTEVGMVPTAVHTALAKWVQGEGF